MLQGAHKGSVIPNRAFFEGGGRMVVDMVLFGIFGVLFIVAVWASTYR